ncbi:DNA-binding pseudobarrel domain superfamily [Arabidopsis suecica]|uniref:DNA-binding pseudobarrel domain superfamily n=1 Tax=Arabidopsis suecica TaxID=45249 RepID=A0A8T2FBP3_ARASU|nr:DNA-binding pseudobarrel domain superfamily [Arabidopsis suecica]
MEENSSKKTLSETMSLQDTVLKFFRVYIPNQTADDMNLPLVSDKISGKPLPRKVTVKSVSSGKIWRMEMKANGNTVFLRDGWKKIVKDENVTEPIFLEFEFDGYGVFHFCVYEYGSMCKRMRSPMEKEVIKVDSEEDVLVGNEESTKGLEESPRRGGTSRRRAKLKTNSHKIHEHLDNKLNPSFPVDMTQNRTRIPSLLIKDYNLTFPNMVIMRDKIGILKRRIVIWKNRSVYLNGIGSIIRRNHVKPGNEVVFELKMVNGYHGLVHEIKVHIIKA